jgi:hypothetical protein
MAMADALLGTDSLDLKKKKTQIGINHIQEGISRGRQPAGQIEGEQ